MPADAFKKQLQAYKTAIDADIHAYADYVRTITAKQYGPYAEMEVDTFLDILARGGKRLRGALVMAGYEMCGGKNRAMIVQAARAIEMLHAYMLICDDIQDRSAVRRGKPSAHELLATVYRERKLRGDIAHAAVAQALNAALAGAHAAQIVLANLNAAPQLKLNAISITNRTLAITSYGQAYDIMNELTPDPAEEDIRRVLEWKTAQYSFVNPLHVGMVLAGAGCRETDAITPFARHMGVAFQMIDDILGVFGNEKELGKSPMDDIREGKGTLLLMYALQHAAPQDRAFLRQCLGNAGLTEKDFARCREIIAGCGAKAYAEAEAARETAAALETFAPTKPLWSADGVIFLEGLAAYLAGRTS